MQTQTTRKVDFCLMCRHGVPLYEAGQNGLMLVRCQSKQKPEAVLEDHPSGGWVVEEKYEGCPYGERVKFG